MMTRQAEIRMRSRRASAPTDDVATTSRGLRSDVNCGARDWSGTPGERGVLSVVLSAHIVPREAERAYVAPGRMRQRETVGGRMACVVEMQRLGRVRTESQDALRRHVDQARRLNGPFDAVAFELDWR